MNPVMAQILGGAPDPVSIEIMFDATPDMRQSVRRSTYDDLQGRYEDLKQDNSVLSAAFEDMSAKCSTFMAGQVSHEGKVRLLQERVEELEAILSADDRVAGADAEIVRLNETVRIQRNVIARLQTEAAKNAQRAWRAETTVRAINGFATDKSPAKHRPNTLRPINQIRRYLAYWLKGQST